MLEERGVGDVGRAVITGDIVKLSKLNENDETSIFEVLLGA